MSDKFLQLRNNYCCQCTRRQHKQFEYPQYSQRVQTETPPPLKLNNYTQYQSPRKLMKTTQASFFDQFKRQPTPKPTAYQTYLQTILEHKNILQAKQNYQPSFTMHNIYGQKINTFRKIKDTITKKCNHQQNKTECKISSQKITSNTQFNSPRKTVVQIKQGQINSTYKTSEKLGKSDRSNHERLSTYNNERVSICERLNAIQDNFDDIEPWNTSEIQQMNQ